MNILVLNPGSSSLKSGFYRFPGEDSMKTSGAEVMEIVHNVEQAIDAVGVRVVHGGSRFENPAIIDDECSPIPAVKTMASTPFNAAQ